MMELNHQEESTAIELTPGIGIGFSNSQDWLSLVDYPLLILVGLTGAGKTTVNDSLRCQGLDFTLLPNRRTLTDKFIIPTIIKKGGFNLAQSSCRITRFYYTNRYKQIYPAGMVHVLSQLQINLQQIQLPIIFDGLRGKNEVNYAIKIFPKAKFVLLEAPEYVRLQRLLVRNDSFDQVAQSVVVNQKREVGKNITFADLGVPEALELFSREEMSAIFSQVQRGIYSLSDLRDRLMIMIEERRSYHPATTKSALAKLAPERHLIIDTTDNHPQQIADQIIKFMGFMATDEDNMFFLKPHF